jgi:hypothetical protein
MVPFPGSHLFFEIRFFLAFSLLRNYAGPVVRLGLF